MPCWVIYPQSPKKSTNLSWPRRPSSHWSARNLQILSARPWLALGFPGGQRSGVSGRVTEGLKERQSESGIMKQFITDLITVKSHSNHRGANKGNPFNITREKKGAIKMLKSSKDEDGFVREQIMSLLYLLIYFSSWPLMTHVQNQSLSETLWNFPSPIQAFKTSLDTSSF